ncbi:heparin lyase I family protein [Thalassobius sp. Cn5-15]|uniref:heparin lyase I family protein n=1 Tax=Thalassobius sp. Cn5-15 TaxID=2917763 RepID=UPI001EF1E3C0|nr:heparin lyase I family protein [Thalassobius sp. Cn5-15]MCG7491993.1 polysaccharide lyase [Thalassobius sp. Cn5-15]
MKQMIKTAALSGGIILAATLTAAVGVQAEWAKPKVFSSGSQLVFSDSQWENIRIYDNCSMKRKIRMSKRLEKAEQADGRRYLRFTLRDGDKGACGADNKPNDMSPFRERVELKQKEILARNARYSASFDVRFMDGFDGHRETFWQLHSWDRSCKSKPPMRFMFRDGLLSMQPLLDGKYKAPAPTAIHLDELKGRWQRFRVEFDTADRGMMQLFVNDTLVADTPFEMADCAVPHMKFGIYRHAAAEGTENPTSVVDFSYLKVQRLK